MYYLVIYDVPSDRIRPKLADICLDHGLERIQYSAFLGEMALKHKQALLTKLKRKLGNAAGNIHIYPICERDFKMRQTFINQGDATEKKGKSEML